MTKRIIMSSEVNQQLLNLIVAISMNANAHDDDLADTWETLKTENDAAMYILSEYIKQGEK